MHGNQWVLKIAVLKYYSVSKRGTTAKSNPKQATDPISLHTKFGDNSSNTFPLNERKPCVTPDIGRRTPDIGHRTAKKAKIIYPPPRGVDIILTSKLDLNLFGVLRRFQHCTGHITTGSWKGRGNQYIQFVRVLYCKLPTNGKQLPAFPLEALQGIEPWPQRWEARVKTRSQIWQ